MKIVPDAGGALSTWAAQEEFSYRGHLLSLRYQAEPPHGDFIYTLTLLKPEAQYRLPLWIFGRSLFFFGPSFLLGESVQTGSFSGLKSVIVDLSGACLDDWYQQPRMTEQGLALTRFHDKTPLLLTPSSPLIWKKFDSEGAGI